MSLFSLAGRVAVITGSSRGIGKAIAERFAEHGAKVVISSRKAEPCAAVAAAINGKHGAGTAISVPANISSKDDLKHLVDETTRQLGPVDVLVCNAASNPYYGPMAGISDEQFRKILDNNIVANHWLIGFVAPRHGRAQGRLDHHRVVDRRAARFADHRRVLHQQGRRPAAGAQPGGGIRPAQRARELHRARADQDRLRTRAVGRRRGAEANAPRPRRCAASASPTRSPVRPCSWPRRRAPSSPARRSSSMAA